MAGGRHAHTDQHVVGTPARAVSFATAISVITTQATLGDSSRRATAATRAHVAFLFLLFFLRLDGIDSVLRINCVVILSFDFVKVFCHFVFH